MIGIMFLLQYIMVIILNLFLKRVQHEYSVHTVFPNKKEVFNALRLTPF